MSNLAKLLFAEAVKNKSMSIKDATAIAWVVKNREKRGGRFGKSEDAVIFAPHQFTGVGSNEWRKADTGDLTKQEREIYGKFQQVAALVQAGKIPDPTNGADHYFNPALAQPSWAKNMKQTYDSGAHTFYKE